MNLCNSAGDTPETAGSTPVPKRRAGRFRLAPKARLQIDRISGQPVLLYPEGVLVLNSTAAAIVELCDGQRTWEGLASALATRFEVEPATLEQELGECLDRLQARGLIRVEADEEHA